MSNNILTNSLSPEEKNTMYKNLVETSKDLIWQCDLEGRLTYLNPAWEGVFEYSIKEIIGRCFIDFQDPETAKRDLQNFSKILQDGEVKEYETIIMSKSARSINLLVSVHVAKDNNGIIIGTRGTAYDITDRKLEETELKKSKFFFEEAQRAANIGCFSFNIVNGIWESSEILNKIFGIDKKYIYNIKGWNDLIHPDDIETANIGFSKEVVNKQQLFNKEYRIIRKSDGKVRWINSIGKVEYDIAGHPVLMLGTILDITESREIRDTLSQKNQFIASLVNISPDILYIYDLIEQKNTYSNNGIKSVLGYSTNEIKEMGSNIIPLLMHPDDLKVYIEKILPLYQSVNGNERITNMYRMRAKNGEWIFIESVEIIYSRNIDNSPREILGVAHDITELKKAEEALKRSEDSLQHLLQNLYAGVVVHGADTNVILANEQASKLLGLSTGQMMGKVNIDPEWCFTKEDNTPMSVEEYPVARVFSTKAPVKNLVLAINRPSTKDRVWVLVNAFPDLDLNGNIIQAVVTFIDITELKNAEQALFENNARHTAMIANIGDVIGIIGSEGITKYKSPNIERWFGWKPEDLVGLDTWHTVHKDDQNRIQNEFQKIILKESAETTVEYRYKCKDGTYKMVELTAINRIKNPAINGILLNYHDISARKQTEELLHRSDIQYKSLFQNLNISFSLYEVIYDESGNPYDYRFLAVNPMYEKTVGIKASLLIGKTLLELFPQTESSWLETISSVVLTGNPFSIENYASEVDKWIELTIYIPEKGQMAFLASDITERKQSEKELQESEDRFNLFLEKSPIYIFFKDENIRSLRLSKNYEKMLGLPLNKLIGKNMDELFPSELSKKMIKDDIEIIQNGKTVEIIEEFNNHIYRTTKFPIKSDGHKSFLAGFTMDITEETDAIRQKETLTEQLHQSQKMEAIGQLAGGIAHDFNNSLGGIIGAADMIKRSNCSDEKREKFLDLIISTAERAGDLTKKLLLFSRKGNIASSTVDMKKLVNDTVGLLGHVINKNISILVENNAIHTSIFGDDSLLQNVMMNIPINSSQAMPEGGKINFTLNNVKLSSKYCSDSIFNITPGDYLEIVIQDSGVGMSKEILSHIFEPFFTTKKHGKGTGLGLSIVYGTIQDHQGVITVSSEEGVGTVFNLYFPISNTESVSIKQEKIVSGTGTILVIDDEELIRITTESMLNSLGYKVICAENGQIGVEKFSENRENIDLIILDMIMPVMGGRDAYKKLRGIDPKIPIVISSGFAKAAEMEELENQGISGSLHKPFHMSLLAKTIANILNPIL